MCDLDRTWVYGVFAGRDLDRTQVDGVFAGRDLDRVNVDGPCEGARTKSRFSAHGFSQNETWIRGVRCGVAVGSDLDQGWAQYPFGLGCLERRANDMVLR
jgi:hypothetical protein